MVTDSGGVQEETSVLGTPCLTYRTTTERPVTVELGTNELSGSIPRRCARPPERMLGADVPAEPPRDPALGRQGGAARRGGDRGYLGPKRTDKRQDGPAAGASGATNARGMQSTSRTLVMSPPELWELIDQPDRMQGLMCALVGRATR